MPKVRVLDIGSGPASVAAQIFSNRDDVDIVRADIDSSVSPDVLWDVRQPPPEELLDQFDIVYAAHVLQYIERDKVTEAMANIASTAKTMGEIWFVTPALEFAARQIASSNDSPATQVMVYGLQDEAGEFYKTGFSLNALRYMMELTGLVVRKAYAAPYTVNVYEHRFDCLQNVAIGLKVEWPEDDPAGAIE